LDLLALRFGDLDRVSTLKLRAGNMWEVEAMVRMGGRMAMPLDALGVGIVQRRLALRELTLRQARIFI
jgi:hypothetical protein